MADLQSGPKSPLSWKKVPTPNPDQYSFVTTHEQNTLQKPSDFPKKEKTLYKNWNNESNAQLAEPARIQEGWGDYIYVDSLQAPDGYVSFLWCKNPTAEELAKPQPFRRKQEDGNHSWPMILLDLGFSIGALPATVWNGDKVFSAPRFYERVNYIPSTDEGSQFVTEYYFQALPFAIPQYPAPQPGAVQWSFLTTQGSFPECLHDDITIFRQSDLSSTFPPTTSEETISIGTLSGQFFPHTNFKTWLPYVLSDKQTFQGGWYRERITVRPPPLPKNIIQNKLII